MELQVVVFGLLQFCSQRQFGTVAEFISKQKDGLNNVETNVFPASHHGESV